MHPEPAGTLPIPDLVVSPKGRRPRKDCRAKPRVTGRDPEHSRGRAGPSPQGVGVTLARP